MVRAGAAFRCSGDDDSGGAGDTGQDGLISFSRCALSLDQLRSRRHRHPHDFLKIMGDKVGRSMLCGIPLQQQWMHSSTGDFRADVLHANGRTTLLLFLHGCTLIAMTYRSLTPEERLRFDPMITGFQSNRYVRGGSHPASTRNLSLVFSRALGNSRSTRNSFLQRWPARWPLLKTKHWNASSILQAKSGFPLFFIVISICPFRDQTRTLTWSQN